MADGRPGGRREATPSSSGRAAGGQLVAGPERAELMRVFGQRLRRARVTGTGLSVDQLAERCDLARATITRIELGRREPGLHVIVKLCSALGVPPEALMGASARSTVSGALRRAAGLHDPARNGHGHSRRAGGDVSPSAVASNGGAHSGFVNVLLGEFDPLLARGLVEVLREDPRLHVFAGKLESVAASDGVERLAPWVVLADERAEAYTWSQWIAPGGGIVVLAREPTLPYGMLLLAAGVSCLASSVCGEDIRAAVRLTAQGGCVFGSGDGERVTRDDVSKQVLTQREIEVLEAVSEGKLYNEIAADLQISVVTAKKHVRKLWCKLKARCKGDLVGLPIEWLKRVPAMTRGDRVEGGAPALVVNNNRSVPPYCHGSEFVK